MTTIAKALQYLTDYMDGSDEEGAKKAAEILQDLSGTKRKPHDDGYLNSVLAIEWRNMKGPKPKLYLDVKASRALVNLVTAREEKFCSIPLRDGVLTTESLREAASSGIRRLVDEIRKQRNSGGER